MGAVMSEGTSFMGDILGRNQGRLLIIYIMLRVVVKDGDSIEKSLKQFKRKVMNTKLIKQLRDRQEFEKPSVTKRKKKLKALYTQQLKNAED